MTRPDPITDNSEHRESFADVAASFALILCIFSMLLGSCKEKESAASYNDRIIAEIHRASERLTSFYLDKGKHDGQLDALESYMAGASERLSGIGQFRDDNTLIAAAGELLDFYSGLCANENRQLIDMISRPQYTPEDSVAVQGLLTSIIREDNRHNQEFIDVQAAFAREHGVILVRNRN